MSMLAERKRKTKWVVNPTKKPLWTQDTSGIKWGKDLMEKMGWSAGKGLGLKEQGIEEPLRVSYKNDTKGMGFKGHDEDWIEHQDEFNMLLSQLSNKNDVVEESGIEKPQVKSLELKSKHSRARVHYQKFTRGKDLSNYSEKDLACILGLNKAKEEKSRTEVVTKTESKSEYETTFGVTTINSGSIEDYFKKKYSADKFKANNLFKNVEANENITDKQSVFPVNEESKEPCDEEKNHKKRKHKSEAGTVCYETIEVKSEEQTFKKKKTLKSNEETDILEDSINCETIENESEEQKSKKRKTEKSKEMSKTDETEKSETDNAIYEVAENRSKEQKSKKRKTSKCKVQPSEVDNPEESNFSYETIEKRSEEQKDKKKKTSKGNETSKTEKLEDGERDEVSLKTTENGSEELKFRKRKATKYKGESSEIEKSDDIAIYETLESKSEEQKIKKRKTEKSRKISKTDETEKLQLGSFTHEATENESKEKYKKKKTSDTKEETSKTEKFEIDNITCEIIENECEEQKSKKRKTTKLKEEVLKTEKLETDNVTHESTVNENEEKKCKKKKTSKSKEETEKTDEDHVTCLITENESELLKSKKKKSSKSKKEPPIADETEKLEITEIELYQENKNKNKAETNSEETKVKKKRRKDDKINDTSENSRQTLENIERSDHFPDESLSAILKEQNTKSKKEEKKSKHERQKSMPETEKVTSTEDTVEDEGCRFLKEKKSKKRKDKSNPEIEVDNVDNLNPPGANDEQGNRELVEIFEKKYKIKRKGQESVETRNDLSAGAVNVSESNSQEVTAGAEGKKETVSEQGPVYAPKRFTSEKVLDLIRWADIKEFRGSNLKTVLGYGFKKEILKNESG